MHEYISTIIIQNKECVIRTTRSSGFSNRFLASEKNKKLKMTT